jgi:hypothetical protein
VLRSNTYYENFNRISGALNGSIVGHDIHFVPNTRTVVKMKMMG